MYWHKSVRDVLALARLSLGDRPAHSNQSAFLFWLFAFTYEAYIVILFFGIKKRRWIAHLTTSYDKYLTAPTPKGLQCYLEEVCDPRMKLVKYYQDEFVFLWLVKNCLNRNYQDCQIVKEMAPDAVPYEALDFFKNRRGHPVFK